MSKIIHFPRWAEVLSSSDLDSKTSKAYKISIRWYLSWCAQRSVACSVDSAREFVEWAQREKNAENWAVDRWKDALRWFFVTAKAQRSNERQDEDVGRMPSDEKSAREVTRIDNREKGYASDWSDTSAERIEARSDDEAKVLTVMRQRGMALTTERNYISHFRDLMKRRNLRAAAEISAPELKAYLDLERNQIVVLGFSGGANGIVQR